MKKFVMILALTTALGAPLSGCNLAPDFKLPSTAAPETFREAEELKEKGKWKVGEPAAHFDRGEWWKVFKQPELDKLQAEAATGNLTVQAMEARVRQSRAAAGQVRSQYFPVIDGNASATRQKPNAVTRGMAAGNELAIENSLKTGLTFSYELDLFGRVRNRHKAAKAEAENAEATLQSMRLAMQADVADLYFLLRALDRERGVLSVSIGLREDALKILKKRMEIGSITELDIAEATVDLENTRIQYQDIIQQRKEAEHALALLLGKAPSEFSLKSAELPRRIPVIPSGVPSSVLERRPDVTAAQYKLAAENARIGVVRASFFPSLSLTGNGGVESDVLSNLFRWSSRTWAIGPLLTLPVFSGGADVKALDRQKAVYEEAVAEYRLSVIEAFRDVENSLSRLKSLSRQASSQAVAEKAAKRASELAGMRYDNGDVGYLEAITARRGALETQRSGIQIQGARLRETVRLIRAIGGSWDPPVVDTAAAKPAAKKK
ncbi:MAG: efflux transporter outer membrane subunit [Alphaproteobacteria bacterium]|nr:efflux transporter outer membrane subunit [Alphaproteobacteria bacterium]